MTRPAAIAVFPPIGSERTSTNRPKARPPALHYHSAAMTGRPAAAVNAARTRLLPALLTALGVVLLTAGLLSYADPTTAGAVVEPSPTSVELPPSTAPSPSPSLEAPSGSAARVGGPDRDARADQGPARRGTRRGSSSRR